MAKKGDGAPKLTKALLHQTLAKVINRTSTAQAPLGTTYYVTSPNHGVFKALMGTDPLDPDIVGYVPRRMVAADILRYCERELSQNDQYQLTARDADGVADYWAYGTQPVPEPQPFSWPGESGLSFTRLPWHPVVGTTPTWDLFLNNMSNVGAFKIWVGSLFDMASYAQQYVWIRGGGSDGKGALNRFMSKVFGPAYVVKYPPSKEARFWTGNLIGKRLVVFPDCNDQNFITSSLFKSLVGADPVSIEEKNGPEYTTCLKAKYLVLSNNPPEISSEVSDKRRIIYCEMTAGDAAPDSTYEEKLWEEGGAFLGNCIAAYKAEPAWGMIPSVATELDSVIEDTEIDFHVVFDNYFEKCKNTTNKCPDCTSPSNFQNALNLAFKSRESRLRFTQWLAREHKVKKTMQRLDPIDGKDMFRKVYCGLKTKPLRIVSPYLCP